MDSQELKSIKVEEISRSQQIEDNDARELQQLGYRQQLNVRYRHHEEIHIESDLYEANVWFPIQPWAHDYCYGNMGSLHCHFPNRSLQWWLCRSSDPQHALLLMSMHRSLLFTASSSAS